jgi:hypothetical protein
MALTTDLYSGSFMRRNSFVNAPYELHTADPAHNELGVYEGENAYTYTAPKTALPLTGDESWGSGSVTDDPNSRPFDVTPWDTAYGPDMEVGRTDGLDFGVPGGTYNEYDEETHDVHSENLGAVTAQNYGVPSLQFGGEEYQSFRLEGESNSFAEGIPALAGGGQRGLNSLNVNNPALEMYDNQGYRRGFTNWWRANRKFNARIIQRHDMHALFDNLAYAPVDQRATQTPDGSMYNLFGKSITDIIQKPQLRRSPDTPSTMVTNEGDGGIDSTIGVGF